jgi:hypothetical protein
MPSCLHLVFKLAENRAALSPVVGNSIKLYSIPRNYIVMKLLRNVSMLFLAVQGLCDPNVVPRTKSMSYTSRDFETYVHQLMLKFNAPGLAVGIIDGNKTWTKVSRI